MAVLLAVFLGIATKSMCQRPESPDAKGGVSAKAPREARLQEGETETQRPDRAGEPGSKLRSLFDVRKGEIAALTVPPEIMKQLLIPPIPGAQDGSDDANYDGPKMVGVLNRKVPLSLLQPVEDSVRGVVDTSEDTFDLKVGSMTISGSAFGVDEGTRLQMKVGSGANSVECLIRISEATCVLLSSGGENPAGVLIVTGPRGETNGAEK